MVSIEQKSAKGSVYLQVEFDWGFIVILQIVNIWWKKKFSNLLIAKNNTFIFFFQLFVALAIAAVVAEPEAEAGAPNPYFGPPYQPNYYAARTAYHNGYYGYPAYGYYGYPHLLGKRSAEAEPEAEADPAVVYHGVPSYGYPYHPRYYGHLG